MRELAVGTRGIVVGWALWREGGSWMCGRRMDGGASIQHTGGAAGMQASCRGACMRLKKVRIGVHSIR